jgi:hypothetical protein
LCIVTRALLASGSIGFPGAFLSYVKISQDMSTRTALQNAASIAGLMLTTEAVIARFPEDKGHGMGGMDIGM